MASHIRIASDNAKMGLPEVSLGVIPGYGGTQRLANLVGKGKAMEMITTACMLSAHEAKEWGLVNYVCNQEDLKKRKRISTNTLLIHGDTDQVVMPNFLLEAKDFFIRNDIEIETHLIKGCDHHIPIEASSIALNYILKKF